MTQDLCELSAVQAVEQIRNGIITSQALVSACLTRIADTDDVIKAWTWIDPDYALVQAKEADRLSQAGYATGPLHGVPVGLKDIIDTKDMPTQCGSPILKNHQPATDARLVEQLRKAGAVIMGKTATTEFAYMHPSETTNPHDASRSPAGSSSGSAAAVAARQVPLAVGTQTGGSVIRPASFCGVYGMKPSRGLISRTGVFRTSRSLDHVGGFANSIADVSLLIDVLGCYDQSDPDSVAHPRPKLFDSAQDQIAFEPDIAWFDFSLHDLLDSDARSRFDQLIDALGPRVKRLSNVPQVENLTDVHKTIYDYELAQNINEIASTHGHLLSSEMHAAIQRSNEISHYQYEDAIALKESANAFFQGHFGEFDAILAPSAIGEALPLSEGSTGDAVFCKIWTLAGLPALSLPLLAGDNNLPIGVQLIGAAGKDDQLMRTASWVQNAL
ncbi:MAG: amidase [Paracoccaceae bacterium]